MTMKEIAKLIIASINPGRADISSIGDGTIKGAIKQQNENLSNLQNQMQSFEDTKADIVGSGLGTALGMSTDDTWADIVDDIVDVTNNGAISKTITPSTSAQSYTIPAGYHNGAGKLTVNAATAQSIVSSLSKPTQSSANTSGSNMTIRGQIMTVACTIGKMYVAAMAGDPGKFQNFSITGATIITNLTANDGNEPPSGTYFARMVLFKATSSTVTIDWGAGNAGAIVAQVN